MCKDCANVITKMFDKYFVLKCSRKPYYHHTYKWIISNEKYIYDWFDNAEYICNHCFACNSFLFENEKESNYSRICVGANCEKFFEIPELGLTNEHCTRKLCDICHFIFNIKIDECLFQCRVCYICVNRHLTDKSYVMNLNEIYSQKFLIPETISISESVLKQTLNKYLVGNTEKNFQEISKKFNERKKKVLRPFYDFCLCLNRNVKSYKKPELELINIEGSLNLLKKLIFKCIFPFMELNPWKNVENGIKKIKIEGAITN